MLLFWHHESYGDNWFFITNNYIQTGNTENNVIVTKTTCFHANQIKRKKLHMKPSEKQFFENAIHNQDEYTKIRLAEEGIFLDILLNDESSYVREAVARQKYRLDVLMYDDDEDVRAVVASLGFGLDALINDKSKFVRLTAQEKLNGTA